MAEQAKKPEITATKNENTAIHTKAFRLSHVLVADRTIIKYQNTA